MKCIICSHRNNLTHDNAHTGRARRRSCERFARYARDTDRQNDRFTVRLRFAELIDRLYPAGGARGQRVAIAAPRARREECAAVDAVRDGDVVGGVGRVDDGHDLHPLQQRRRRPACGDRCPRAVPGLCG